MKVAASLSAALVLGWFASLAAADDWPRFRGPNGSGWSTEANLPLEWSETKNLAWKVDMPGPGTSSPIVVGDRVFVTCYTGYGVSRDDVGDQKNLERHLICVRLGDGAVLWRRSVAAVLPEDPYQGYLTDHGYASSTPASDGERVYVFYGKTGVLAYDLEGNELWRKSVGEGSAIMGWGSAASPIVYQNLVIVNANAESQSIIAIDGATGQEAWKAEAEGYEGSWSTPALVDVDGEQQLAIYMPGEIWGLDPLRGKLRWYCPDVRGAATTSLIASDGVVYTVGGGPAGLGALALRAGGKDDISSQVLWRKNIGSYVPSHIKLGDNLFWADERGVATCVKAATGEEVYRQRIPATGGIYASAVAGDGKLYVVTRRGGTVVLSPGEKFEQLAHNRFESDDTDFNATPAISNGRIVLRSNRRLYCVANLAEN